MRDQKEYPVETERYFQDEFAALCKPLNEWLQKHYCPHAKIVIENDHAEVTVTRMSIPFDVLD